MVSRVGQRDPSRISVKANQYLLCTMCVICVSKNTPVILGHLLKNMYSHCRKNPFTNHLLCVFYIPFIHFSTMLTSIGKLSKQEVRSLEADLKQNMSAFVPSRFKAADMKLTFLTHFYHRTPSLRGVGGSKRWSLPKDAPLTCECPPWSSLIFSLLNVKNHQDTEGTSDIDLLCVLWTPNLFPAGRKSEVMN